jgi:hypothetical protein
VRVRVELARGQGGQDRGVIAVDRDHDVFRLRDLRSSQQIAGGAVPQERCQAVTVRRVDGGGTGVDHDDPVGFRAVSEQGRDRTAAHRPVAEQHDVVSHLLPPTGVDQGPAPLVGEDLQRRADQQDQERDTQRGHQHRVQ